MSPAWRTAMRVAAVTAVVLAIIAVSASPVLDGLVVVFWAAIVLGVLTRGWRAKRRRVRTALSPVADAADAYQDLLLGRPSRRVSYGRDEPTATSLVIDPPEDPLLRSP